MKKLRIVEAYQVPKGNISPDIFHLPCVSWADKTEEGIVYICHDLDTYKVEAYPTDWLVKDSKGKWHVMHDDEYRKICYDTPKEYQPIRGC